MSNPKERLINNYKKCLAQMISDTDFQRYFGPECASKIIKYSKLNDYNNIEQLLPNNKDYAIILTEYKVAEGHWCLLFRKDDTLEWFDSYGGKNGKPDGEFSYISRAMQLFLNEDCRCLSKLLKKSNMNVIYNKAKLQSEENGVSTCGKWCIARLQSALIGYSLSDFIQLVETKCKQTGKPPDILICDWIL